MAVLNRFSEKFSPNIFGEAIINNVFFKHQIEIQGFQLYLYWCVSTTNPVILEDFCLLLNFSLLKKGNGINGPIIPFSLPTTRHLQRFRRRWLGGALPWQKGPARSLPRVESTWVKLTNRRAILMAQLATVQKRWPLRLWTNTPNRNTSRKNLYQSAIMGFLS